MYGLKSALMQIIGFDLQSRYYYSNFTDEETEAQKSRDLSGSTFLESTLKLNTFYYVPHPWPGSRNIRGNKFKNLTVGCKYVK